jgi:acetyl esterase/lipase
LTSEFVRPPFRPEFQAYFDAAPPEAQNSVTLEAIPASREALRTRFADTSRITRDGTVSMEERMIPGPAGAPDLKVLILRPTAHDAKTKLPGVLYAHGGGLIMGTERTGSWELAEWIEDFEMVCVSVDYRLAPEHPYPAPMQDCYAALQWMAEHADELHIDLDRLVIAGSSAGGAVAGATAIMARDLGGPKLSHQILEYPMLDDRASSHSAQMLLNEGSWDSVSNVLGWTALLGDARGTDEVSSHAAPARETNLAGLPSTFIDVGQVDTMRDEVIDYATRLSQAGVPVEFHMWPGAFHGFEASVPEADISKRARAARLAYLRRELL